MYFQAKIAKIRHFSLLQNLILDFGIFENLSYESWASLNVLPLFFLRDPKSGHFFHFFRIFSFFAIFSLINYHYHSSRFRIFGTASGAFSALFSAQQ